MMTDHTPEELERIASVKAQGKGDPRPWGVFEASNRFERQTWDPRDAPAIPTNDVLHHTNEDTSEDDCADHDLEECPDCGNAGVKIGADGYEPCTRFRTCWSDSNRDDDLSSSS